MHQEPIQLKLQTITPMFMAGADGEHFELRPPSIKGAMRFWWRASYWGKNSKNLVPKEIEQEEGNIFGTASDNGRKSHFAIHVKQHNLTPTDQKLPSHTSHMIEIVSRGRSFKMNILEYLAYGTFEYQRGQGNVFTRQYLPAGQELTIFLHIPHETVEVEKKTIEVKKEAVTSFYLLALFGGLGAKSHNGFGSITVMNPEIFTQYDFPYPTIPDPMFLAKLKNVLTKLKNNSTLPTFTAFSSGMKLFKLKQSHGTWDECLAALGKIYREARNNLEPKHQYHKRQYIGAPIVADKETKSFLERHAKPYFMRVLKTDKAFEGYILYLPSEYCGGKEKGLREDRFGNPIDDAAHAKYTREFQTYCDQFNKLLGSQMGVVI